VTGISLAIIYGDKVSAALGLQWGPVVVTGIRSTATRKPRHAGPASMGSGRGDRNQLGCLVITLSSRSQASMGSGRGDRNQSVRKELTWLREQVLQWGPVVVTGISSTAPASTGTSVRFNGVRSW